MLVLGYVGVGNLDFSWAGVILLALAVVLFVLEGQNPGFSYFGAAGAVTLALGGIFLVGRFSDPDLAGGVQTVSLWLVSVTGAVTLGFVLWLAWQIKATENMPEYVSDVTSSTLVGEDALVTSDLDPEGEVHAGGEYWTARLATGAGNSVARGERVRVLSADGLHLVVEPIASKPPGATGSGNSPDVSGDKGGAATSV
jgi:membrane-bound serine protease (ClpP class)